MATILSDFSDALAKVVETAGQSIVRVESRKRLPATGIIWAADGLIVTSSHAVRHSRNITIGLPNGETTSADLLGRDITTDIALLKAEASDLAPITWAEPDSLKVGHLVLALGRPGQTVQVTLGVLSAIGGTWRTHAGGEIDRYLQTDVTMYPGFSGGPLVGMGGQALGLNTSALARGVSLSIPVTTVRSVVEALQADGRIKRGFLGVGVQPVRLPENVASEMDQPTGVLVISVEPDSPAAQGGLVLGDTIIKLDGQPVPHTEALLALLNGNRVGKAIPVQVLRGGALQTLTITIGEREGHSDEEPEYMHEMHMEHGGRHMKFRFGPGRRWQGRRK